MSLGRLKCLHDPHSRLYGHADNGLVRRPRGHESPVFLPLPWGLMQADSRHVYRNLPQLRELQQRTGDRVVDPVQVFKESFTTAEDPTYFRLAFQWITSRLAQYQSQKTGFGGWNGRHRSLTFDYNDNILEKWLNNAMILYNSGDYRRAAEFIERGMKVFEALGDMFRRDHGFGCDHKLHEEFSLTAEAYLTVMSAFLSMDTALDLMKIVGRLDDYNPNVIRRMVNATRQGSWDDLHMEAIRSWEFDKSIAARRVIEVLKRNYFSY